MKSPAIVAVFCLLVTPSVARGQSSPLVGILDTEFVGDNVLAAALNTDLANGITTYPIATSSGGLTYSFDPVLGIPSRSTRSFGPLFAERALTIGRRRFSFGVNTQHAVFDRFEGEDLTRLRLFTSDESPDLGVLRIHLQADTTAFIMSAGVSSRLEMGVVVPVTRIRMDATSEFNNPPFSSVERRVGSAEGFGDVQIKAKYTFHEDSGGGVAAGVTLWLPTGDADNLLGTGTARLKVFGIASAEHGPVAPRVNVGITMPASNLLTTVGSRWREKPGVHSASSTTPRAWMSS